MSAQYEDWADWAGDHPEQAEADLRRDRERAEARLAAAAKKAVEAGHYAPRLASVKPLAEYKHPAPKCDTLGHEYNFGICLDCEQVDPAFEPTDDMIERDYLRGYDRQAAA